MAGVPTHREPTHPGEMLLEEFLLLMGVTQRQLADAVHFICYWLDKGRQSDASMIYGRTLDEVPA